MTEGFPVTLRRKHLVLTNTELEKRCRKRKFEMFSKKEMTDCHKELLEKLIVLALSQCPVGIFIFRDHFYINYFWGC